MKKFYHGTALENAEQMFSEGFCSDYKTMWSVSDEDMLYVADEENEIIAIDASIISAAVEGSDTDKVGVLIFEMEDDIAEEYFQPDDSCENMSGCYQIRKEELDKLVSEKKVQVILEVRAKSYNPNLRPFYLIGVIRDDGCRPTVMLEDDALYQAVKILQGKKDVDAVYYDCIDCIYDYSVAERKAV